MKEIIIKGVVGAAFLSVATFLLSPHVTAYEVLGAYLILAAAKI